MTHKLRGYRGYHRVENQRIVFMKHSHTTHSRSGVFLRFTVAQRARAD